MSEAERFAPSLSLMRPRRARVVLGRLRVPGAMRSIRRASLAAGTAVKSRVGVGSGAGVAALREAGAFLAVVVVAGDLVAAARGEGGARVAGAVQVAIAILMQNPVARIRAVAVAVEALTRLLT
jgi:hypothetical protein